MQAKGVSICMHVKISRERTKIRRGGGWGGVQVSDLWSLPNLFVFLSLP